MEYIDIEARLKRVAARIAREDETDELTRRLYDPEDPYDAHHGDDRTVGE